MHCTSNLDFFTGTNGTVACMASYVVCNLVFSSILSHAGSGINVRNSQDSPHCHDSISKNIYFLKWIHIQTCGELTSCWTPRLCQYIFGSVWRCFKYSMWGFQYAILSCYVIDMLHVVFTLPTGLLLTMWRSILLFESFFLFCYAIIDFSLLVLGTWRKWMISNTYESVPSDCGKIGSSTYVLIGATT